MINLIYLHGFASSNQSEKVRVLKKALGSKFYAPELVSKPMVDVPVIESIIKSLHEPLIVGTSLGGFYGEYFSQKYNLKSLLINPLLDIKLIEPYIGEHKYYYSSNSFIFEQRDYKLLLEMESQIPLYHSNKEKCVLLSADDDVIPCSIAMEYYRTGEAEVNLYENMGHSFSDSEIIINAIKRLCSQGC